MPLSSFSGNVFVLRSSYVKNSTRRWVTLSQSVRRETNFSKNRIWPQPTRYVFILEINAKKVPKYFLPQICWKQTFAAVQRVSGQPWKTPDATLPGHCQDPAKCIIWLWLWFVDFQDKQLSNIGYPQVWKLAWMRWGNKMVTTRKMGVTDFGNQHFFQKMRVIGFVNQHFFNIPA